MFGFRGFYLMSSSARKDKFIKFHIDFCNKFSYYHLFSFECEENYWKRFKIETHKIIEGCLDI